MVEKGFRGLIRDLKSNHYLLGFLLYNELDKPVEFTFLYLKEPSTSYKSLFLISDKINYIVYS